MKLLTKAEVLKKMNDFQDWTESKEGSAIEKKLTFENFTDAVCFLNQVAEIAEQENHHPDLHLTNYKHLRIVLSTHSDGGLTRKDFNVAEKIDKVPS